MNFLKCGGELSTSLKCLDCGIQYELVEKISTTDVGTGYIPIGSINNPLNAYTYNGHFN